MNVRDKKNIIKRYASRFKEYGTDIRSLASGSFERQQIRFSALSEVGSLYGKSILDIGCGFGDFYKFLKEKGIHVEYTGIDICEPFVKECTRLFPEARFFVHDIFSEALTETFDYIISSQTFNNSLQYSDNMVTIKKALRFSYKHARIGVAIDMLTSYVDFRENHLYYYHPEEIFMFCKSLTKRITLRHDYSLYEFMVYLYKDFGRLVLQ